MSIRSCHARALLVATCLTGAITTAPLQAQEAQGEQRAGAGADDGNAIVVTANRQEQNINRAPLSITALTPETLEQQGLRDVKDIARAVPSLAITRGDNNGLEVSIRGIVSSGGGGGGQTTGIYLDDTPLQKRRGIGAVVGNGNPFPPIFDLERIEVLRGPQGTLYGGSSQGGAIRFIQPSPSLTTSSVYGRAQVSTTKGGDPSYEMGVAFGGPIIEDILGFRASIYREHQGGYLDHYDQYTGQRELENTNEQRTTAARLALSWAPTDGLVITPSVYGYRQDLDDAANEWLDQDAVTTPTRYFTATGLPTSAGAANLAYTYPSHTYGPYDFYGRGRTGAGYKSPATSWLVTPSLTIDAQLGSIDVISITSHVIDKSQGLQANSPSNSAFLLQAGVPYVAELPDHVLNFYYDNKRTGWTQEIRFSSQAPQRLSWVAGVYYATFDTDSYNNSVEDLNALTMTLRGVPAVVQYRVPLLPGNTAQIRDQSYQEESLAAFGQLTYSLTDSLRATVGLRVSQETNDYRQAVSGPFSGYLEPTVANGGLALGSIKDTPISPKVGLEYELQSGSLLYANAAKGFRAGGINLPLPDSCAGALAAVGIAEAPATFGPDTLWAYEAGAKLRLLGGRAQINSSVFWNNWTDIQFGVTLPGCVFNYTANAGSAVSRGADIQASLRLTDEFTVDVSGAYTDAYYKGDIRGPAPAGSPGALLVADGDPLPTAPWSFQVGAQYRANISGRLESYVRADYQYQSAYKNGPGPTTSTHRPDQYQIGASHYVSARAGITSGATDLSIYANNLLDSKDILAYPGPPAGRVGCLSADCSTYRFFSPLLRASFFRPREIGITATYRY